MSESNTATVAAQVINSMDSPEPASVRSTSASDELAAHRPDIAQAEIAHLLRDQDPENHTARIAAINIARSDPRRYEITRQGNVRREHVPSGYGSDLTSQIAREVIDLQNVNEGRTIRPEDRRALAIQRFVESNPDVQLPVGVRLAEPGTPEYYEAANAAIDAIVRKGRGGNR